MAIGSPIARVDIHLCVCRRCIKHRQWLIHISGPWQCTVIAEQWWRTTWAHQRLHTAGSCMRSVSVCCLYCRCLLCAGVGLCVKNGTSCFASRNFLDLCDVNGNINQEYLCVTCHKSSPVQSQVDDVYWQMMFFLDLTERRWYSVSTDALPLAPTKGNIAQLLVMHDGRIFWVVHIMW